MTTEQATDYVGRIPWRDDIKERLLEIAIASVSGDPINDDEEYKKLIEEYQDWLGDQH